MTEKEVTKLISDEAHPLEKTQFSTVSTTTPNPHSELGTPKSTTIVQSAASALADLKSDDLNKVTYSDTSDCQSTDLEEGMVSLTVKWGKETLSIELSLADWETFSYLDLKEILKKQTTVPTERQKLLGLGHKSGNRKPVKDEDLVSQLHFARPNSFMLIGTVDHKLLKDASHLDLPEIENDFEYTSSNTFSIRTELHLKRLNKCMDSTNIHLINPIKKGLPLLVIDLDYTVIDCKGGTDGPIGELKRPYLEEFMRTVGPLYNIAIWSQTSWKWVEMKCTALGFLTSPFYNITFVLDRSSMFTVSLRDKSQQIRHVVKALEIIWSKFPNDWGPHNTIHVDDLSRNFAFNPSNGLKVTAYRRHNRVVDKELFILSPYLKWLSTISNFHMVEHKYWRLRVEQAKLENGKILQLD